MNRRITSKKLAIALALATIPILVGCGSSSSNNAPLLPGSSAINTSGYPTLAAGAIPASMPPTPGSNQSFAGQNYGVLTTNGCVPVGQQITFSGSGAMVSGIAVTSQTFYSNGLTYGPYTPGNLSVTISNGTIYGTLQLSQYEAQQLEQSTGATCISGIALVGNLDTTPQYPGFEGFAALYVNNGPHGFITDQFMGAN